jgi:DNA invertase Pin-like site-specific DNA recombinase
MIANILASVAAYEIEVSGERIRAGIKVVKEALKNGTARHKDGSARTKYGNGRPAGSWVKCSPAVQETMRRMKESGVAVARIARECRVSRQTVYAVLDDGSGEK